MSSLIKQIDAEISAWARWARSQYPSGYGNSPCDKWDKPSFGTAFIDQSSETTQVPFELRHINQAIEHGIEPKHRRIIHAVYVLWFNDPDGKIPSAVKSQIRARAAGCSVGVLDKIKDRSIRAVAVQLAMANPLE